VPVIVINEDFSWKKEVHIAWCETETENKLRLYEIVERYYPHPDAPEQAFVQVIEKVLRGEFEVTQPEFAAVTLLRYAQRNIFSII